MIAFLQHRIGDKIQGRYEVERPLGAGAFGTVYLCCDRELNVHVAVKELHVLDDAATTTPEREPALRQFRLEATHLSHLRHPHIVSGHYQPHHGQWNICPQCGLDFEDRCPQHIKPLISLSSRHYLMMEYVDGPNLSEAARLAGGALPVARALRIARDIAGALAIIHERGWIHRDVKPENIRLRTRGDQAVLLDFGIAGESGTQEGYSTRVHRHTQGGGTPGYAPESFNERRLPDARSDIHALGMTLYAVLCGRDPTEPQDLALMRGHKPSYFNSTIPPALDALILRAIHLDPSRRPQDGTSFVAALDALNAPSPVAGTPTGEPQTTAAPGEDALKFRNGARALDLQSFALLADQFPSEAREMLMAGTLAAWLDRAGHFEMSARARQMRAEFASRPAQALEGFLQTTSVVEVPRLRVEPAHLDFGTLEPGQRSTIKLRLSNPGRGHLFGLVRAVHPALEFDAAFDGESVVPIAFHARQGRGGSLGKQQGELVIDCSAGELRVPFSARVRLKQTLAPFLTVLSWAMLGMAAGQFLRVWPMQTHGAGWGWLQQRDGLRWLPTAPLFGFALTLILFFLVAAEAQRRRSCGLIFGGTALSLLCGVAAAVWGNTILVTGDEVLHPLFAPLAREFAAGAWLFLGCIVGAAYGTFRRRVDVFSPRLLHICAAWLSALMVAYGVLAAALKAH